QREYELLSYRLLRDRILAALDARNAALPVAQRLQFQQAVHFAYRDGAPMLTVGGILVEQARTATLNECGIDELHFYRPDEESFSIELPKLTRREVHYLLREVPENPGDLSTAAQHVGVSVQDARKLANLYRYASLFVEADEV
ncbi:MAG: O-methyltransferase, partial [Dehalococcoidia bacterium]